MWEIIVSYLILSVSILAMGAIVPGIKLGGVKSALKVAAVYGLLNFVLFKLLIFVTFPLLILKVLTLGLFGIVLNAALLMITDKLLDDFKLAGFGSALLGAAGISLVNLLLQLLF